MSSHRGSRELRPLSALGLYNKEVVKPEEHELAGQLGLSTERHSGEAGLTGEGYQAQLDTEEEYKHNA